mgnify:CR=1 FL=1
MNLKELNEQIKGQQRIAATNLDDIPDQNRPAWGVAKRQANERLVILNAQHQELVVQGLLAFFPNGNQASVKQFSETALKIADAFTVDVSALYEELTDLVWTAFPRSGTFNVTQVNLVNTRYASIAFDSGLKEIKSPDFGGIGHYTNRDELRAYVKKCMRKSGSDSLVFSLALNNLDALTQATGTKAAVPVVFINTDEEEAQAFARVLVDRGAQAKRVENFFTLTEKLNEEAVMGMLGKVKNKVVKKQTETVTPQGETD